MRILIADDDPVACEAVKVTLEKRDYEVVVCRDGAEAWAMLQADDSPSLAVLDWNMPGLEGPEVCRKVRERSETKPTFILLLTGRGRREDIVAGLEAGADDYITKPFDPDELHARVRVGARVVELQERLLEAERSRVLVETAGAAAHEINQPLTVVMGLSELLLTESEPNDQQRENLESIYKAGKRIDSIVHKMKEARQYATRSYLGDTDIVDFDKAADGTPAEGDADSG